VLRGTTAGASSSFTPSCSYSGGLDLAYTWVAPRAGTYTFDLSGSSFDTVLTLRTMSGAELACDTDSGTGSTSLLSRAMRAGEAVLVVVDSSNAYYYGAFELRIY
jgi:hypothetical protein